MDDTNPLGLERCKKERVDGVWHWARAKEDGLFLSFLFPVTVSKASPVLPPLRETVREPQALLRLLPLPTKRTAAATGLSAVFRRRTVPASSLLPGYPADLAHSTSACRQQGSSHVFLIPVIVSAVKAYQRSREWGWLVPNFSPLRSSKAISVV